MIGANHRSSGLLINDLPEATLDVTDDGGFPYSNTEEHFTLREVIKKERVERPELQWHLLNRTKHGKATINSRHIKVEFYIHHDEYQDGADLADILAREVETLGEQFCETNLKEEVSKCSLAL